MKVSFIDEHRAEYGVEPICAVLPIAPSTYHARKVFQAQPERQCPRARWDDVLRQRIRQVWKENFEVYGVRKVWRELKRKYRDEPVARCTVARLMGAMGLQGAVRGRKFVRTTVADEAVMRPQDLVTRQFQATTPNQLWVADLTYLATWPGFAYVTPRRTTRRTHHRTQSTISRPTFPRSHGNPSHSRCCNHQWNPPKTSRCATPIDCWRPASTRPSAAAATRTTTRSPDQSSVSSKRRGFKAKGHGDTSRASNSPPWSGSTGSTISV